jgi:hypothetical protein
MKKTQPKAQLGTIVKTIRGAVKGAVKGAKAGYKAAKRAKKKPEGYGDKGQYSRLKDMKQSEWHRDRRTSGKTMPESSEDLAKFKLKTLGVVGGLTGAGVIATALEERAKKKAKAKAKKKMKIQGKGTYKF